MLTCELSSEQAATITANDKAVIGEEHQLDLTFVVGTGDVQISLTYRVIAVATEEQMGSHDKALLGQVVATSNRIVPEGWYTLLRWRGDYATLIVSGTRMSLDAGSPPTEEPATRPAAAPNPKKRRTGRANTARPTSGPIAL